MQKRLGKKTDEEKIGVNVILTAIWDIAALSAEDTLILMDRLRFEATHDSGHDSGAGEVAENSAAWKSPEEQVREMMAAMHQPPSEEYGKPLFLCIARLNEEQLKKATTEAFARACQRAEVLAQCLGKRLGPITMVTYSALADNRHDKMMERQHCLSLLSGTSYVLGENEIVSEDHRATEFTVSVHVYHSLE
jgi:hypothetical protein